MDYSNPSTFYEPNYWKLIRNYDILTGSKRGLWGSINTFVSVPYTFLRSDVPIRFHAGNGPYYFIFKESRPGHPVYGITQDTLGNCSHLKYNPFISAQPTDRMVTDWIYPTTRNNVKRKLHSDDTVLLDIDTLYVDIQIYVRQNGLNSTFFNGQPIPAEAFDSFPMTNGDYYVSQLVFYNDDIPEIIRISNPNGFSAYVDEFGYNVVPAPAGHPEIDDVTKVYYYFAGASGCFYTDYPSGNISVAQHNADTVYRCIGDTLALTAKHNPDSVPVEWIVDGASFIADSLSLPLTNLDTFKVLCVLHYPCPDTSSAVIVTVPPPVFLAAHDTTLCAGSSLSVEQPDAVSYLWSNGAAEPAITPDSAGLYSVEVTNIGCRRKSDIFSVNLFSQSAVDFGPDTTLCEGRTLVLNAETPYCSYLWQDGSTNSSCVVRAPGVYSVHVSNICFSHWDMVNVDFERCEQQIYLPSAFTPGGDGENDVFLPVFSHPGEIEDYSIEVYNRWGTMVFRSLTPSAGWDGANVQPGVYAFIIRYRSRGQAGKTLTGSVTVVK